MIRITGSRIKAILRDALIIILVTAFLFFAFEYSLRIISPQAERTVNVDGIPFALKDSLIGHIHNPNAVQLHSGPEFSVEYRINAEGLRDDRIHPSPKPNGTTRILILGDSFTFGVGVDYEYSWPAVLERKLMDEGYDAGIVKAGVAGYDTRTELIYLERIFSRYDPDIVVLAFLPNDLFTNSPVDTGGTKRDRDEGGKPGGKKSRLDSVTFLKRLLLHDDFLYTRLYLMTARKEYFAFPPGSRLERRIGITRDLILDANSFCRKKGARFIVLSIPQQFQVLVKANGYEIEGIDIDHIDSIFGGVAGDEGFEWITSLPAVAEEYRSSGKDLYFRLDGHLNNEGNYFIGDFFHKLLIKTTGE